MQNDDADNGSGWLKRFNDVDRTADQLVHTAQTVDAFSTAAGQVSDGAKFECEPGAFFALLHQLAPNELKK